MIIGNTWRLLQRNYDDRRNPSDASGADLATTVLGVFADELARWQRERAHDVGLAEPETGCLLEIQRFADGGRLYPHAHAIVPDGVFVASTDGQSTRFIRQKPPDDSDIERIVCHIESRLNHMLSRWRATLPLP